jgi:hypothetical protein
VRVAGWLAGWLLAELLAACGDESGAWVCPNACVCSPPQRKKQLVAKRVFPLRNGHIQTDTAFFRTRLVVQKCAANVKTFININK